MFCAQCGNAVSAEERRQPKRLLARSMAEDECRAGNVSRKNRAASPKVHQGHRASYDQRLRPDESTRFSGRNGRLRMTKVDRRRAARWKTRMRPRVDKLRRVSSVVLDEAAYDPSVRFVLVVGVLFVLFLVLLLLSKWIGLGFASFEFRS